MIYDDRFADYTSVRKATPEEIEFGAYPNATVETVIIGLKGLTTILNAQFPGEDFKEGECSGVIESEYEQLLTGWVSYCIEISYVEHFENGRPIAEVEAWGGMHKYV